MENNGGLLKVFLCTGVLFINVKSTSKQSVNCIEMMQLIRC